MLKLSLAVLILTYLILTISSTIDDPCTKFHLVRRESWGSKIPLPNEFMPPPSRIIIHHTLHNGSCTSTDQCSRILRELQHIGVNALQQKDLNLHFLIGGDGKVYEGLGWIYPGEHTRGYRRSLGIAFIGDFENVAPNDGMLFAVKELILCGIHKGYLDRNVSVYGHIDSTCSTKCPGTALYKIIKIWRLYGEKGPLQRLCE